MMTVSNLLRTLFCFCILFVFSSARAGVYMGGELGYTNSEGKLTYYDDTSAARVTSSLRGFNEGIFAGYEWLWDHFSFATEFSAINNQNDTQSFTSADDTGTDTASGKLKSTYGIDLMPGYFVAPNVKLFLLAGYQQGSIEVAATTGEHPDENFSSTYSKGAFDYGLGTDISLTKNLALRAEYRYINFENIQFNVTATNYTLSTSSNQFNLGLVYRF